MASQVVLIVAGLLTLTNVAGAQTRPSERSQPDSGDRVEFAAGTLTQRSGRSVSPREKAGGADIGSPQSTPRICTNCDD